MHEGYGGRYDGEHLEHIAFPIGGIGAGMLCLEGAGALSQVSLRHGLERQNEPLIFSALAIEGRPELTRVLEGPVPRWKVSLKPGSGLGAFGTSYGLPRFREASFAARFPFATVALRDASLPVSVEVTGWSPFVPPDADASSLPFAAFMTHDFQYIRGFHDARSLEQFLADLDFVEKSPLLPATAADAAKLDQRVARVALVLREDDVLVVLLRDHAELHERRVSDPVQRDEVGAAFFESGILLLEQRLRADVDSLRGLPRSVADDLVHVGQQVLDERPPLAGSLDLALIPAELLEDSLGTRSVVGIHDVSKVHAL